MRLEYEKQKYLINLIIKKNKIKNPSLYFPFNTLSIKLSRTSII